jgi:hypothetical protein
MKHTESLKIGAGASSDPLLPRGGLHGYEGLEGASARGCFGESGLKKSPAFGAFARWCWYAGAGDNVA